VGSFLLPFASIFPTVNLLPGGDILGNCGSVSANCSTAYNPHVGTSSWLPEWLFRFPQQQTAASGDTWICLIAPPALSWALFLSNCNK